MALAVDTATSATANSGTSLSWTHTGAASPSNYLAVVGCYVAPTGAGDITSVTYGGQAMTLIAAQTAGGGTAERVSLYGIINPPVGSQTVQINFAGTVGLVSAGAITFTGADQATGWHNSNTNSGTAATIALTITSATGEITTTAAGADNNTNAPTTTQTARWTRTTFIEAGGDTAPGAATVTHTWTITSGNNAIVGASIMAAAGGATPLPIFVQC